MNRTSWEREEQFLTIVIMCGPPPPKPDWSRPRRVTKPEQQQREQWIYEVHMLCRARYDISYLRTGLFITQMDEWWLVNKEERR